MPAKRRAPSLPPSLHAPRGLAALCCGLALAAPAFPTTPVAAQAAAATAPADGEAGRLWNDFSHYVLIARPELAAQAGEALVNLPDADVLAAVEADTRPTRRVFNRAAGMEAAAGVSARLEAKLAAAGRAQALDPERIADDVSRLSNSQRAFDLAVDRLNAAGPYAAPELLRRLQDPQSSDLHPYIVEAMQAIGRPLVAPLSVALPELPPVAQGQVARVLADIGYPGALPALREVMSDQSADPDARQRAQRAFQSIAISSGVSPTQPAADLYTDLGNVAYGYGARGEMPPGYQASSDQGPVWVWSDEVGLVPVEVPGPLYADALARSAAVKALRLEPGSAAALTLFLSSDLRSAITSRRELSGEPDPSRDPALKPADYYLSIAGPEQARAVLTRGLVDGDAGLALAAVEGAAATGSTEGLAPLTEALNAPDRRVRFAAASGLAAARPQNAFPGDAAVVPALAAAIRRDGNRYAVVLAAEDGVRNTLSDASASAGFEPLLGDGLGEVRPQVDAVPGVDLIVVRGTADSVTSLVEETRGVPALATAPVVAFVSAADQVALEGRFGRGSRVSTVVGAPDTGTLEAAAREVLARAGGEPIGGEEAEAQAVEALRLLRDLSLDSGTVLQPTAAMPAVIAALEDDRPAVATAAGDTAASMDERDAQEALARVALNGSGEVQVAHLRDLAESAARHGNLLSAQRGDELLALVKASDGELALAAAEAHGALTLPTEHAVELILDAAGS